MVYPKPAFTPELADAWLEGCFTTELLEQFVFNLLQHLPFASELAATWSNHPDSQYRSAGYVLTLRLLISKKIPVVDAASLTKRARILWMQIPPYASMPADWWSVATSFRTALCRPSTPNVQEGSFCSIGNH